MKMLRIDLWSARHYHILDLIGESWSDIIQQARDLYPNATAVEIYSNKDVRCGTLLGAWNQN